MSTDVIPFKPPAGAVANRSAGQQLADLRTRYLPAFAEADRIIAATWGRRDEAERELQKRDQARLAELLSDDRNDSERRTADAMLADIPSEARLSAAASRIAAALRCDPDDPADHDLIRAHVGLMLASFPRRPPESPETFFEVLCHHIIVAEHSPGVVAAASADIVRTVTFWPSIAEVLAACDARSKTLKHAVRKIEAAQRDRLKIETAIADAPAIAAKRQADGVAYAICKALYRASPPPPRRGWSDKTHQAHDLALRQAEDRRRELIGEEAHP